MTTHIETAHTPELPQVPSFGIIDPDYARIFTMSRCIGWQEGYAVCAQGSFTRDLDLLVVPWAEYARKDPGNVVRRIASAADLNIIGEPSDKPHGRKAWTLKLPGFGDPRFVDVSVMPVSGTAEQQRDKLLEALTELVNQPQDITTPAYQAALAAIQECEK